MTPALSKVDAKLAELIVRLRKVARRPRPPSPTGFTARPRSYVCGYCGKDGHSKRRCPDRWKAERRERAIEALGLWTDGVDIFIARSAEEARQIATDPLDEDELHLVVPIETWHRVDDDPLEIWVDETFIALPQRAWIAANLEQFPILATRGADNAGGPIWVLEQGRRCA